jgi:hypothetical protein
VLTAVAAVAATAGTAAAASGPDAPARHAAAYGSRSCAPGRRTYHRGWVKPRSDWVAVTTVTGAEGLQA